jgi:hypothetical protein
MATTIIAKNQTAGDLLLDNLAASDRKIPASGQVMLTDYNRVWEIQEDTQLRTYINDDKVLLNLNGVDLNKEASLYIASPPAGGGSRSDNFVLTEQGTPYVYVTGSVYDVIATIIFPGTDIATPSGIKAVTGMYGGGTGYVRVYDVTSSLVVVEKTFTDAYPALVDLGALSNLSAAEAIWEIQMKEVGATSIRMGSLEVIY